MSADLEWLDTGRHSRCPDPACLSVDGLKVRPAAEGWEYRCFTCGKTGKAGLKTPEEQGKWVDGLGGYPYE